MKLLMWLAFFGLVIAAAFLKISSSRKRSSQQQTQRQFDDTGAELMVRCFHCGIYIPSSEAMYRDDRVYCCEEHLGKPASP
jgi:hypothetical protein